jgi:RNA polymerase sigma-70 factor (ECF subfamily)
MESLWHAGRAEWPNIDVSYEAFAAQVARHADGEPPSPERAGDVYLACAVALRAPRAAEAFDRVLTSSVARAVARIDGSRAFVDLVAQELRARLLLGDPPKIADYAGRAPLAHWLKTAAVRTALNARRAKGDRAHDSVASGLVGRQEIELDLVRDRYRAEFEEAVRVALRALPPRERAILCGNVRDGLSIDKLGEAFGVSRATAARWLASARETLAQETRRVLLERLRVTPAELDSVAAVVRSRVDVSLGRLLGESTA